MENPLKALVFRMQLFKPSETFIAEQTAALPTASALLMGRKLFGKPDTRLAHFCPKETRLGALRLVVAGDVTPFMKPAKQFGATLIHAHFAIDGLYAQSLANRLQIPLITTLHGFDITTKRVDFIRSGSPSLTRYALMQDRLKRQCSTFICVSEFMRQQALKAGFPETKLRKHFIGVDTTAFQPTVNTATQPTLLHVARLVEKKGTSYLIRAFANVLKKIPDARLNIVGGGPLLHALQKLSAELGVEDSVVFHGVQPHAFVRTLLTQSSALVLPSVTAANGDAEGLGMVLLEAAATGLPTIGTRHGGIPEAVRDGETGLLVQERNVDQLADAMFTLLCDSALRQRMGTQARQMVEGEFDIVKQSRELETIYQSAS